jgi:hypothetical protein
MPLPTKEKHVNENTMSARDGSGTTSRLEAAAKAAMIRDSGNDDWPTQEEIFAPGSGWQRVSPDQLRKLYAEECGPVLAAADAVMFSAESIDRAARVILDAMYDDKTIKVDDDSAHAIIRDVVAALKGDA